MNENGIRFTGLVKTNLRKIDSPIIVTFLRNKVFVPVSKKIKRDMSSFKVYDTIQNNSETIQIKGPLLDMNKDFPIWATVLKEVDLQKSLSVSINENDFLAKIGYGNTNINKKNKLIVEEKISNMLAVQVKITRISDDYDDVTQINLFTEGVWDRKNKVFSFKINEKMCVYYEKFKWKAIDIEYYNKLKTEYAKALFLFYESHSDFIIPINRDVLLDRLGLFGYSRNNNANRKLTEAHDYLKSIGFLKDYDSYKDSVGNKFFKVEKVPKKDRGFILN